jgi:hypothetical protein
MRPLRRREPQPEPAGCPCPTCRSDWYIRDDHFALWMRVHGAHDPETAPYDWQRDGL